MKVLSHPKSTTVDDRINEEVPTDSSYMWITRATIRGLHTLADRIQDRIDNLQAAIANIIDGATQAITDLCTELGQAKKTITSLERQLRDMTDARDKIQEQADLYLADSRQRIKQWETEQAKLCTIYDDAINDSQTKLKEAGEKFDKLEKQLREAADKITELESHLQRMDKDRGEPADDGHTEAEDDNKRILQLKVQSKYWQKQLKEHQEATTEKIQKAAATAKKNADIAAERREEIARADAESKIKMLKLDFERKEEEFTRAKNQSAGEITALKKALAKKKEDDERASSFNPVATVFTPSPANSSHSTLPPTPYTSIPATPFSPSPSAASFSPSPSPRPTTLYQQTPIKKEPMSEDARRNLAEINKRLRENKDRKMMGKSAEDAEPKPLSEEELSKSM